MNYRRKIFSIDFGSCIHNDTLTVNLQTFEFSDEQNTITGYLRWIPKFVSNDEQNKNKIVDITEYKTLSHLQSIVPLTTKRLKYILEGKIKGVHNSNDQTLGTAESKHQGGTTDYGSNQTVRFS